MSTFQVTLKGEKFQFGLDDVIDYLSQYGVVTLQQVGADYGHGWMSSSTIAGSEQESKRGEGRYYRHSVRIYFHKDENNWSFNALDVGETQQTANGTNHLDKVVEEYLEKIGKLETV